MATFLQICQSYSREANFATLSAVPTAVTGQAGRLLHCVDNVIQAWIDIQERHEEWMFLRVGFTFSTSASDGSYAFGDVTDDLDAAVITRFNSWRITDPRDPPKIYLTSEGVGTERFLTWTDWDSFKRIYQRGTQNNNPPAHISVDPQNNLRLGPVPDAAYTITGDYKRSAQILAADADVPDCPYLNVHNLIWAYALGNYGMNHAARHILHKANVLSGRRMRQLEANQLPTMQIAGPMA